MAVRTFTSTRAPAAGDSKLLRFWSLSAGAVALVVRFCNGAAVVPIFEVQVPVNSSASQAFAAPECFPLGLHVEVVSGTLNRGSVDV